MTIFIYISKPLSDIFIFFKSNYFRLMSIRMKHRWLQSKKQIKNTQSLPKQIILNL